jgi:hypothetical protein
VWLPIISIHTSVSFVSLHTPQSASGNAAKAGIKAGDTIIYHSSFFGDELWPADKLSFVNQSIRVRMCLLWQAALSLLPFNGRLFTKGLALQSIPHVMLARDDTK